MKLRIWVRLKYTPKASLEVIICTTLYSQRLEREICWTKHLQAKVEYLEREGDTIFEWLGLTLHLKLVSFEVRIVVPFIRTIFILAIMYDLNTE